MCGVSLFYPRSRSCKTRFDALWVFPPFGASVRAPQSKRERELRDAFGSFNAASLSLIREREASQDTAGVRRFGAD